MGSMAYNRSMNVSLIRNMGNASSEMPRKFVVQLSKEFSENTLRAALIQCWANANDIPLRRLERGQATAEFLLAADPLETARVVTRLQSGLNTFPLKALEAAFESLMGAEQRKSYGAVYTPDFIIDNLLEYGLTLGWRNHAKLPMICDPCCGSAGFLIRAAEQLRRQGIGLEQSFAECLVGFDKDAEILRSAKCLIELYLASNGVALPAPELRLHSADILLSEASHIWLQANAPNGFNLIATNPPYVKLQNLEADYRAEIAERYAPFARGSFSLSPLFLIAGHKLLADNGCLAVITQNNLFTSLSGVEVRRYLQAQQCLRRIVTFGSQQIFHNASAYTCLLFVGAGQAETFEYGSVTETADANTLADVAFNVIRNEELKPEKWRLADETHLANLKKIEATGRPLGELTNIRVGFATLKDTVFQVRRQEDVCVTNPINGVAYEVELEITAPMVKIAELSGSEDLRRNPRRVIFPYRRANGQYRLLPEEELRALFPKAYTYLTACRDLLRSRDKGNKTYEGWYAWGRTQGMEARGPKLLTKTFSKRPNFILDPSDQLFCNGYAIFPRKPSPQNHSYPLEVYERLLNSRLMYYYARLTSFEIEGNFQCYQKNFIERFGVADMNEEQVTELLNLPTRDVDPFLADLYALPLEQINKRTCPATAFRL